MKKVRSKLHPTEIGVIKTFSLSPNDEIGEIAVECSGCTYYYNNLAELCEKWEDVDEAPKGIVKVERSIAPTCVHIEYSTEEEAEKAVKKLKAWKRLKDKGFRFTLTPGVGPLDITPGKFQIEINADMPAKWFCCDAVQKDLDACFGGEE